MADGAAPTPAAASSFEVDLGNLMAYDPSHHAAATSRFTPDSFFHLPPPPGSPLSRSSYLIFFYLTFFHL